MAVLEERVREVREKLFASETIVARAHGRARELFPIALGLEEGLALRDWAIREGDQAAAAVLARTISSAGIVSRILALLPTSISLINSRRLRRPNSA